MRCKTKKYVKLRALGGHANAQIAKLRENWQVPNNAINLGLFDAKRRKTQWCSVYRTWTAVLPNPIHFIFLDRERFPIVGKKTGNGIRFNLHCFRWLRNLWREKTKMK